MRIHEVMTTPVAHCGPGADVATAARRMWDCDCGILPIVDAHGRVTGLITDRDIAMAVATRPQAAWEIPVESVTTGHVYAVDPADDVRAALDLMARYRVHRLPVVDAAGTLKGIVSLSDIVGRVGRPGVRASDVIPTLKQIASRAVPVP